MSAHAAAASSGVRYTLAWSLSAHHGAGGATSLNASLDDEAVLRVVTVVSTCIRRGATADALMEHPQCPIWKFLWVIQSLCFFQFNDFFTAGLWACMYAYKIHAWACRLLSMGTKRWGCTDSNFRRGMNNPCASEPAVAFRSLVPTASCPLIR